MNRKRVIALTAAALVAGLALGNLSGAFAARPGAEAPARGSAECGGGTRIGPMMRDAGGRMIDVVADLTGLSTDEVSARRAAGESPAEIAGVDAAGLADPVLETRANALDEAVAAGTISREQADRALERMSERVTECAGSAEGGRGEGRGACGEGAGRAQRGMRGGQSGAGGCTGACPATQ